MEYHEQRYRREIVEVGQMLYDKGLLVSIDGNMSIRINEEHILITASGFCKGKLTTRQVTKTDMQGNVIIGLKPCSDMGMHLAIYKHRPHVKAITHAHPPSTTGFSTTSSDISKITLPEVFMNIGSVGIAEYATPTTEEVPVSVVKVLERQPDCQAIILAHHGALTYSEKNLTDAFYKMETLEMFLQVTVVSKIMGDGKALTANQIKKLEALKSGEKPSIENQKDIISKNSSETVI